MDGVYNADCLEFLREVPDGLAAMVLVDLPYGTTQNKWDTVLPLETLWPLLKRVSKPNAVFAFTASQPFTSVLVASNLSMFRHEWIWIKNRGSNFANTVREPMKEHESVLIFSAGKWVYNKQMQERTGGGRELVGKRVHVGTNKREGIGKIDHVDISSLPELRVPSSWQKFNTEVGLHPTQKPVALFEYLIRTYTNEGDIVLDCCAGSGTTAIAALNCNRGYLCVEKSPAYFDTMCARIEKHLSQ